MVSTINVTRSIDAETMRKFEKICKAERLSQSAVITKIMVAWVMNKTRQGYTIETCPCGTVANAEVWEKWRGVCPECGKKGGRVKERLS
jgi:ferredoxin-thioredoxin reductase catalytic subunit